MISGWALNANHIALCFDKGSKCERHALPTTIVTIALCFDKGSYCEQRDALPTTIVTTVSPPIYLATPERSMHLLLLTSASVLRPPRAPRIASRCVARAAAYGDFDNSSGVPCNLTKTFNNGDNTIFFSLRASAHTTLPM